MAFQLIWGTGFESGSPLKTENLTYSNGYGVVSGGVGGDYAGYISGANQTVSMTYTFPNALEEAYIHSHVKPQSSSSDNGHLKVSVGGGDILIKHNSSTYSLQVGSSVIGTGSAVSYGYHSIQIHVKAHATEGIVEVRMDGADYLSYYGDTLPSTGSLITGMSGYGYLIVQGGSFYYDNFAYGVGGWPGELKFTRLVPIVDVLGEWACSSGSSHFALVDEAPPSESDYTSGSVNGIKDLYQLAGFDATDKKIIGVVQNILAYKDTSGSNQVAPLYQIGGVEYSDSSKNIDIASTTITSVCPINPSSGSPWTADDLSDLIIGVECVIPE